VPRRVRQLPNGSTVGDIGVHDPFDLIRHLARSQSDPRKAVAELVQNALDEQATHVTIERTRLEGESALVILDDGLGVLPKLPRDEALTTIARNIGHSRKRQLSFDERMRQAMLGQYGIGLLGFWSLGHELRITSRVGNNEPWSLTLFEDSARFEVQRAPEVIGREGTWTEVQVRRLHRAAMAPTVGARLASYLSMELRGQLIRHGTVLSLVDRLARGSAERQIVIEPSTLVGERLDGLGRLPVAGFDYPIELTLHYAGDNDGEPARIRLASAGAIVVDDLGQLDELAHPPWNDARLMGVIDFPHLEVPPGSRRGVVPNAAFVSLIDALVSIEPQVTAKLEERAQAASASLSDDMHRQLARLFTRATGFVPHLNWLPVAKRSGALAGQEPAGSQIAVAVSRPDRAEEPENEPQLFPPGPLASLSIKPARLELALGERHPVRVVARDLEKRPIPEGVAFSWKGSTGLALHTEGPGSFAVEALALGEGQVEVTAAEGERSISAVLPVRVVAEPGTRKADAGIPQPEEINDPLQPWRSRLIDDRWQINVGHADYRALSAEARPRLRYLASLLSKEVISRNFPQPGIGAVLEELVGLLCALERSGAWGGRAKED
jgi:hypothetical protein